jgi:DNA primase
VARVREAADIVAVISEYTQLRRVGTRFQGLCPFHAEKSPSFSVNVTDGLYYCFGCGAGGDVITFVREKEQLDFVGAVEWLANKTSITLHYTESHQGEDRRRRTALQEAVAQAVEYYHERLLSGDDAGQARSYLRQRGLDGEAVRRFKLGWAPDGWDALARALRLPSQDLTDSGLGFVNRAGRQQDAFRARIMFPIYDAQGHPVGFGGRNLPGADGPKYKNSAESPVYAKSRVLYGLHWAKSAIVEVDEVIVCEGYTDVIGLADAGMPWAVATCGTALTEDHVKLLRRFARRAVLAFDADAAGQSAAARFYEWERSHDLDVAVADLPAGVDPGELAQTDPERLRAAITGARPFLEFRVDRAISSVDRTTNEGRARAAERALEMVAEHPDELVRDQYVMTVASRCQVEPGLIRRMLEQGPNPGSSGGGRGRDDRQGDHRPGGGRGGSRRGERGRRRNREDEDSSELEALRLAVHQREAILALLVPDLFFDELRATVYDLMVASPSLHEVIDAGGPEVAELVHRLSVEEPTADPLDVASLLWDSYLDRQIESCLFDARSADPGTYARLAEEMSWYQLRREELREPERKASTVEGLLGWVLQDSEEVS